MTADSMTIDPMDEARKAMIDCQLRVSGVNDPAVLAAIGSVRREDFVPEGLKANAYIDRALPLDDGHFLPAPLVQGRLLSEAALASDDVVLVVSPSGYLGALVAALGCSVTTISPAEAATMKRRGTAATVILVDGAAAQLPPGLCAQLAEGGRIVTGMVERGVTRLCVGRKVGGEVSMVPLAEIGMPVLAELARPKRWSF